MNTDFVSAISSVPPSDPSVWLLGIQLSALSGEDVEECINFLESLPEDCRGFLANLAVKPTGLRPVSEIQGVPTRIREKYGQCKVEWTTWQPLHNPSDSPWSSASCNGYRTWVIALAASLRDLKCYFGTFAVYTQRGIFPHRLLADTVTASQTLGFATRFFDGLPAFQSLVVEASEFSARENEATYRRFRDYEAARMARKIRNKLNSDISTHLRTPALLGEALPGIPSPTLIGSKLTLKFGPAYKKVRRQSLRIVYQTSIRVGQFRRALSRITKRHR